MSISAATSADPAADVPLSDMSNLLMAWLNNSATLVMAFQVGKPLFNMLWKAITRQGSRTIAAYIESINTCILLVPRLP